MKKYFSLLLCLLLILGCARTGNSDAEAEEITVSGDTLIIPVNSTVYSRITTQKVERQNYVRTIATTGVVAANPTTYAEVASPFSGRVVNSRVRVGQSVGVGTPLFEVSSSGYSEEVKNYLQSKIGLEVEKKAYDRAKDLYENNITSERELDEARSAYVGALEDFNHAEATLKAYQANLTQIEVGQPLIVRSPIAGKVISSNVVLGEYLKEEDEAQVIVADLSKVWVKANVTEKDIPYLNDIERVEIRLVSQPDTVYYGTINYVGGILDEETRMVQSIIECNNAGDNMLPNMYANVTLRAKGKDLLIVPKSAVLQGEGYRYVLKKIGENKYRKATVDVQSVDENSLIVLRGLEEGDEVITDGTFYLISYTR
ncbi:MAG: efflux RND transporter periplasmic adaptor subunit [Bacteroidales bacterium]|nr:efflux RND transporter periplasmic adaptor subunit [Bacteroidales bacterium]